MRPQALDHCRPVPEIRHSGEEEVSGAREEVARRGKDQEIAPARVISGRLSQQKPENRTEHKVDERPVRRNPPRTDIALQRDRTDRKMMSAAEPGRDAMPQPFMQNILKDACDRRNGSQRESIVCPFHW